MLNDIIQYLPVLNIGAIAYIIYSIGRAVQRLDSIDKAVGKFPATHEMIAIHTEQIKKLTESYGKLLTSLEEWMKYYNEFKRNCASIHGTQLRK